LEEDLLQYVVSEIFVPYQLKVQPKEQGAVSAEQHFERTLIACQRLLD
jgi:hypothetical protein